MSKVDPYISDSLLTFDFEAGRMWWKKRKPTAKSWNERFSGKETALRVSNYGYHTLDIFGRQVLAHRVIFAAYHGYWPSKIDHVNRNRLDNRISNLREVTSAQNAINNKIGIHNTSGYVGVGWHKPCQKWRAYIGHNRRLIHIGLFDTIEEAALARRNRADELGNRNGLEA